MKSPRIWFLLVAALLLGVGYISAYTEWLKPEPIEVIAQFRPLPKEIAARRAERASADTTGNRPPRAPRTPKPDGTPGTPTPEGAKPPEKSVVKMETISSTPAKPTGGPASLNSLRGGRNPRDIQPFVFSLDGKYRLTSVKVVETSSSNGLPPITWWIRSKVGSPPTDNVLYGRAPDSLEPVTEGRRAEKLLPGRTYTLFVEAGRRRGQRSFSVPQEAEPLPPEDGDYHPEKDSR